MWYNSRNQRDSGSRQSEARTYLHRVLVSTHTHTHTRAIKAENSYWTTQKEKEMTVAKKTQFPIY